MLGFGCTKGPYKAKIINTYQDHNGWHTIVEVNYNGGKCRYIPNTKLGEPGDEFSLWREMGCWTTQP